MPRALVVQQDQAPGCTWYLAMEDCNSQVPKCVRCMYGAMTRRPWRTKPLANKGKMPKVLKAGDCISVDPLESPLPGFVPQMKGRLTRQRYLVAIVFVDHNSGLGYKHLHYAATSEETLEAKCSFKACAS